MLATLLPCVLFGHAYGCLLAGHLDFAYWLATLVPPQLPIDQLLQIAVEGV